MTMVDIIKKLISMIIDLIVSIISSKKKNNTNKE